MILVALFYLKSGYFGGRAYRGDNTFDEIVPLTCPSSPFTAQAIALIGFGSRVTANFGYHRSTDERVLPPLDARLGNPHDVAGQQPRGASV